MPKRPPPGITRPSGIGPLIGDVVVAVLVVLLCINTIIGFSFWAWRMAHLVGL